MKMKSIRSIFRRVHGTNKSSEQSGDDLSRSSSITNLNAEGRSKGASSKIKKSASKDRLDKIADKKNDKKGLTKNNNKIDDTSSYSTESLHEIESLQRQLQEMANDKSSLALQLGEQKGHLHLLESEMLNLKMLHEQLSQENHLLRNRLKDVAHSPLSDNEKQQLLLESHRHHNSAPASIATNIIEDASTGDATACPTPDWDKYSSSNVSEISVACLQDRINQMEETHYSTKEELQATVQELNDLQRQLTELQQDNYQLLEEKNLMFDSLCRQTERLNESKGEIESLKQRLRDKEDDTGQYETAIEHEQKLLALLKDTREERELLLMKHEQITNELQEAIAQNSQQLALIEQLNDRIKTLESTLDAKHAEHKQLEREMVILKDQSSGMQIEINRLSDLLENARTKILELEQDRALSDKSELDELLDNARKEKDALEAEVTNLKEQVARSKNEAEKLKDQVSILQEECKVTRNNAKCTQSELEYKCDNLTADKNALNEQLLQLQEAANGLQVQAQCQMEDKRQLSAVLSETQKLLSEAERRNQELESELDDLKRLRKDENEEWEKFQNDLLTSVRVANDFKTEAQQDLQKMILENKAHRDKVRHLEAQIDKLKGKAQKEEVEEPSELPLPPPPPPHILNIPLKEESEKQESEAEYHEIEPKSLDSTDGIEPATSADNLDNLDVELRRSPKSKSRSGSTKSFFKKPKIFRNQKGYYVSGENSDVQGPESLERVDLSLPIIPTNQVDVPPERVDDSPEVKPKKMFGIISGKNDVKKVKKENSPLVVPKQHLSSQEQKDLKMLNEMYVAIDPNIPEEFLSPEQKFIVKLKQTYDSTLERKKAKPVANKPKNNLAISKPLLTSVISNPKLKQIADDPTVRLVEDDSTKNLYNTSNVFYPVAQASNSRRFEDIHDSTIQFSYYDNEDPRKTLESFKPPDGSLPKSKSLNDLYFKKDDLNKITNFPYERQHSTGSLTNFVAASSRPSTMNPVVRRPESIASTFSENSDNSEPNLAADLAKKRSFYNNENLGETLDELCLKIDPNLSESELTNEQKFVKNMKVSMDEMGRKQTLRKQSKRNTKISEPTKESVWSNPKLASVIKDPKTLEVKPEQLKENKENKIRKLLDIFKPKKTEGSPPPPKKILAKKQISQEDIVHVSLPPPKSEPKTPKTKPKSKADVPKRSSKSTGTLTKHKSETSLIQAQEPIVEGPLTRHKSETNLIQQGDPQIDTSESTSSLFKSVITNSDLQKLIERRSASPIVQERDQPHRKAYENEDNSSFNSDLYDDSEDVSSLDQHNLSDSSKKDVIHRISSIPPTESFNTFVKQKISPHSPKTVFNYDELNSEIRTPKSDRVYIEKLVKNRITNSQEYLSSNHPTQIGLNQFQLNQDQYGEVRKSHLYIKNSPKYKKQVSSPTRPPPPPPTGQRPKSDLVLEPAQSGVDQNCFNFSFKFEETSASTTKTTANYEDVKEEIQSQYINEEDVEVLSITQNLTSIKIAQPPIQNNDDSSSINSAFEHHNLTHQTIEDGRFEVIEPPVMFSNLEPPNADQTPQIIEIIDDSLPPITEEVHTTPPNASKGARQDTDFFEEIEDLPLPPIVSFEDDESDYISPVVVDDQTLQILEITETELVPPPPLVRLQTDEYSEIIDDAKQPTPKEAPNEACQDINLEEIMELIPPPPMVHVLQDAEPELTDDRKQPTPKKSPNEACEPTNLKQIQALTPPPQLSVLQDAEAELTDVIKLPTTKEAPIEANQDSNLEEMTELEPPPPQLSVFQDVEPELTDDRKQPTPKEAPNQTSQDTNLEEIGELIPPPPLVSVLQTAEPELADVTKQPTPKEAPIQACQDTNLEETAELIPPPLLVSVLQTAEPELTDDRKQPTPKEAPIEASKASNLEQIQELTPPPQLSVLQDAEAELTDVIKLPTPKEAPNQTSQDTNLEEIAEFIPSPPLVSVLQTAEPELANVTKQPTPKEAPIQACQDTNLEEIAELIPPPPLVSVRQTAEPELADVTKQPIPKETPIQACEDTNLEEIAELIPPPPLVSVPQTAEPELTDVTKQPTPKVAPNETCEPTKSEQIKKLQPPPPLLNVQNDKSSELTDDTKLPIRKEAPIEASEATNFEQIQELTPPLQFSVLQTAEPELTDVTEQPTPKEAPIQACQDTSLKQINELTQPPPLVRVQNDKSSELTDDTKLPTPKKPPIESGQDPNLEKTKELTPPPPLIHHQNDKNNQNPQIIEVIVDTIQEEVPNPTPEGSRSISKEEGPQFITKSNLDETDFPAINQQVTAGSLILHDNHVEIRQSSCLLKLNDRDADFERDSVNSSTSFSTEIDDTDPNFGSILNPKSRTSRQSSVSSEEEIFRRLSYRLDQQELSFFRDVYKKYEVDRTKSPINDTDMAIIERAKLNSLSPEYDETPLHFENSPNFLDNDVFIEELRKECQGGDDVDDDGELTPAELELIRRIKSTKEERPISDINDLDLRIIDTIRQESLSRKSSRCSDLSSTTTRRRSIHAKHDTVEEPKYISTNREPIRETPKGVEKETFVITEDRSVADDGESHQDSIQISTIENENSKRAEATNKGEELIKTEEISVADDEKSHQDRVKMGAIESENSKNADAVNREVLAVEQPQTDDVGSSLKLDISKESMIGIGIPNWEIPEDVKDEELVRTEEISVADEEKLRQDRVKIGAIESETSKNADDINQGVLAVEQFQTDDAGSSLKLDISKESMIGIGIPNWEIPEDIKDEELVRTEEISVADDEKSHQNRVKMDAIESEASKNAGNINQEVEQPKNDYLESLLAATIIKRKDKPVNTSPPPISITDSKVIDDGGRDMFDFLRKPTAKKMQILKSDPPKRETGERNRGSSFIDDLLIDDDQDAQSRYRISSWVKKTVPKRSSVNESIKARQSAFLQADRMEVKQPPQPQVPLKVKAKLSHTDDFWKKSQKVTPNENKIRLSVPKDDFGSLGVARANSISSDLSKDPDRSRNLYKSNSIGGRSDPILMGRSKSVEPIWSTFRSEKDNSSETASERSASPRGYEPIYANYKELQLPRKPVLMKLKKAPIASPRYDKTSKFKVDTKNAFDSDFATLNMDKEHDSSSNISMGSIKPADRDRDVSTDLSKPHKLDDNATENSQNKSGASGTKPKKGDKVVSKTANFLPSKTSSMDILYDSEESAAISEKSSIDKSYLDLFKSPEQVVYDNLSETDQNKTKTTFTTIHFYKSGDISSESSNASTVNTLVQDEQQLPNQKSSSTNNKVSFLRKKFEKAKNQSQNTDDLIEEDVGKVLPENSPIEKTQSIPANHVLKSVPKASNLPQIIGEVCNQERQSHSLSSTNTSLENLRKNTRKSFESARSVFELKVKKQDSTSEEQINDIITTNENLNSETQIDESNANQNNQTVS